MTTHLLAAFENGLVALGAREVLAGHPGYDLRSVTSLGQALEEIRRLPPAVLIFSDRLDPELDPVALAGTLQGAAPDAALILVGHTGSGALLHNLLARGLRAYLYVYDPLETCLPQAVMSVLRERTYLSPTAQSEYLVTVGSADSRWVFDEPARRVLRLMVEGWHVKRIAQQEGLTVRQVYGVQRRLRRRFRADTNEQMILQAVEEGFLPRY